MRRKPGCGLGRKLGLHALGTETFWAGTSISLVSQSGQRAGGFLDIRKTYKKSAPLFFPMAADRSGQLSSKHGLEGDDVDLRTHISEGRARGRESFSR